jgi:hypothetical protein
MPSYHYAASIEGGRHTADGVITTSIHVTTQEQYKEVKKVIAKVFDDFFGKQLIVCAPVDPSQVFVYSLQLLPEAPPEVEDHG